MSYNLKTAGNCINNANNIMFTFFFKFKYSDQLESIEFCSGKNRNTALRTILRKNVGAFTSIELMIRFKGKMKTSECIMYISSLNDPED